MLIANARHFDRDCRMLSQGRRERIIQHVIVFANVLRDRLRHQTANPKALVETSGMSQQAITQLYQQANATRIHLEPDSMGIDAGAGKKRKFSTLFILKWTSMWLNWVGFKPVRPYCHHPFTFCLFGAESYRGFFCFMLPFSLGSTFAKWRL